jgi:hypothetical protein
MRDLVIQAAIAELENRNPSKYWDDVWKYGGPRPEHWCGAFALWCLHQAGLGLDIDWKFEPEDRKYGFLYNLPIVEQALVGDILYVSKPYQHHAVIEGFDGKTVWTVDGNSYLKAGPKIPRVVRHERELSPNLTIYSIEPLIRKAENENHE